MNACSNLLVEGCQLSMVSFLHLILTIARVITTSWWARKLGHSKKEGGDKPCFSDAELACRLALQGRRQPLLGANATVTRCLRRVFLRSSSIKLASSDVSNFISLSQAVRVCVHVCGEEQCNWHFCMHVCVRFLTVLFWHYRDYQSMYGPDGSCNPKVAEDSLDWQNLKLQLREPKQLEWDIPEDISQDIQRISKELKSVSHHGGLENLVCYKRSEKQNELGTCNWNLIMMVIKNGPRETSGNTAFLICFCCRQKKTLISTSGLLAITENVLSPKASRYFFIKVPPTPLY